MVRHRGGFGGNGSSSASVAASVTPKVAFWGDSLANGSAPYLSSHYTPALTVYNGGVGGENALQILTRMQADTLYRQRIGILWDRQNLPGGTNQDWVDYMVACVALFESGQYIVISDINKTDGTEDVGSAWRTNQIERNGLLAAAVGTHWLDLVDLLDNDSLRNPADHLHPTTTAVTTIIVPAIAQKLYDLGYMNVTS